MKDILLRLINLVGLGSEEKGVCHGSGVLALQAFILGTEYQQSYIKRLEKMAQLNNAEFDDEALKHELESRDEQGVLKYPDILAHLQTVKLLHSPDKYLHLSDSVTVLRQSDVAAVASIAQSQLAEKRGGIRPVSSFSAVYRHTDFAEKVDTNLRVEDNRAHVPIFLQKLFSFFAATSVVALGSILSFYFLGSTPILLAIIFTTAIVAAITVKYLPVVIAQGYALMMGSAQENKLANLSNELEVYLTSLQKAMETSLHKETRCGLLLSSERHVIMLGYDAANSTFPWTIDDTATVTSFSGDQCVEVAKKIREIFTKDIANDKSLMLCTSVYSTGDQLENAKSLIAIWHSHCEEIHRVTAEKAKLTGPGGVTWLFRAAESGHTQIVELLLKKATDINATTSEGRSPLYMAAGNGHIETVKLLLAAGAKVNEVTSNGFSPLHYATEGGYTAIVELLLAAGAEVNAAANNGFTPLHFAADSGYIKIVKCLLEKGADTHALTSDGLTPLDMAENECAAMIRSWVHLRSPSTHGLLASSLCSQASTTDHIQQRDEVGFTNAEQSNSNRLFI